MSTRISAKIRAMAESDVLRLVPARIIRDIKRDDPHPLFKAFVIGGEGEWRPTIVGIGQTIQRWFRGAVQALGQKLNIGTKVFDGHEQTNAHDGRTAVGEVIGKTIEKVKDTISAIAVTYIYPQFKDIPFDVASIEADLSVPANMRAFEVDEPDVLAITGIALGNSAIDMPAFPGATLQAALQAFAEPQTRTQGGGGMKTLDEVKAAIQEGRFLPSQLFDGEVLVSDPVVRNHVKGEVAGEWNHRKRTDEAFDKARADWEKEKGDLTKQIGDLKISAIKPKAAETLVTILKERKIDGNAKLSKFVQKAVDKGFTPADEATLKKDLDKFVDAQLDEFKDLFGDAEASGGGQRAGQGGPGTGANEGTPGVTGDDLTDPKKNDFIPQ